MNVSRYSIILISLQCSARPRVNFDPPSVIHADYSEALSTLLRYPGPSSAIPFSVPLLLSQAILLRDSSSTPQTGVAIVMQNQEALGISANPPPPPPEEEEDPRRRQRRGGPVGRGHAPAPSGSGFGMLTGQAGQRFQQAQMGLAGLGLNELAKGFIDKGKEMGIDKAILARVAEVRVRQCSLPRVAIIHELILVLINRNREISRTSPSPPLPFAHQSHHRNSRLPTQPTSQTSPLLPSPLPPTLSTLSLLRINSSSNTSSSSKRRSSFFERRC
jgi:hypothetical protein